MKIRRFLVVVMVVAFNLPNTAQAEGAPTSEVRDVRGTGSGSEVAITLDVIKQHRPSPQPVSDPYPPGMRYANSGSSDEPDPAPVPGPSEPEASKPKFGVVKDWRVTEYCQWRYRGEVVYIPCSEGDSLTEDEEGEESQGDIPSPVEVLYTAMDTVSIEGAGLVVQPTEWVYTNIPTLAHAQTDTIHTSAHVFGLEVPITLTATSFEFDFHDGNQPVRSPVPGLPYPSMEIYGVYTQETDAQTVTLRTTWRAVATHPITGDSIQINGAVVTVEESAPFKVKKRRIRLSLDKDCARH